MENWLKKIFKRNDKDNLYIIKQAIIDYRIEGKKLMFELGEKYKLDISNLEHYEKLIIRSNVNIPRSGKLSKSWNYSFHGGECGFYSNIKECVEVVLSNPPEFGHIDAWFLLSYMQSTEKYKKSAENMDWQGLQKMINKLYENKEVENIE